MQVNKGFLEFLSQISFLQKSKASTPLLPGGTTPSDLSPSRTPSVPRRRIAPPSFAGPPPAPARYPSRPGPCRPYTPNRSRRGAVECLSHQLPLPEVLTLPAVAAKPECCRHDARARLPSTLDLQPSHPPTVVVLAGKKSEAAGWLRVRDTDHPSEAATTSSAAAA
jgi:hypothetical protein